MTERGFIHKLVRRTEEKFGGICYAHKEWNTPKTFVWWSVCVDNYELYTSDPEFKKWTDAWHKLSKAKGFPRIVFFYCNPLEKKLQELAEEDNLIMNI